MWSQIISSILFSRCTIWIKYQPNPGYGNPPESLDFAYCFSIGLASHLIVSQSRRSTPATCPSSMLIAVNDNWVMERSFQSVRYSGWFLFPLWSHFSSIAFQILNVSSVSQWLRMTTALSESDGFEPSSMLCVPIFNGTTDDVIGVAQLINKVGGGGIKGGGGLLQGDPSGRLAGLGWLWFGLLHHKPGSAWADGKLAELAEHLADDGTSQIKVNPTQLSDQMNHPVQYDPPKVGQLNWETVQIEKR